LAFDALWAVAIALNNSIDRLKAENRSLVLNTTDGKMGKLQNIIFEEMRKVDFQGIGVSHIQTLCTV